MLLSPWTVAVLLSPKVALARAVVAVDDRLVVVAAGRGGGAVVALGDRHRTLPVRGSRVAVPFCHPRLTVGRHAHILSVALTVPRLGRRRPWRRGQPYPDAQGDR